MTGTVTAMVHTAPLEVGQISDAGEAVAALNVTLTAATEMMAASLGMPAAERGYAAMMAGRIAAE